MNRIPDEVLEREFLAYRAGRQQLLEMAAIAAERLEQVGPERFAIHVVMNAPDKTAATNMTGLAHWHRNGLQSVELSHKLAAALMATNASGALDHARLPWPAFEIRIPPGLLESSHGELYSCVVQDTPEWLPRRHVKGSAGLIVLYYDERSIGHIGVESLAGVARFEPSTHPAPELGMMREVLRAEYDKDREGRLQLLLMRLVTGVILLVNEARADKPQAFPQHPLRPVKRGHPRVNTHRVTRSITIDVTATVRDYVRGVGRDSPHVTTLVRGHWRQQAHGPRHTLRRTQWIEPFWRGEGPVNVRSTKLADP
jgi:hypothetical protein